MLWISLVSLFFFSACDAQKKTKQTPENIPGETFVQYWYQGNAEVNTYELRQSRYGEIRQGYATLIFVTEDFDEAAQVKSDRPDDNDIKVMKTNLLKRFTTGIYDYSVMTSAFMPVNTEGRPRVEKITCSIQDWCGQVFTQLNRASPAWDYLGFSYFEQEGDRETKLRADLFMEEIPIRIRLNPANLPQGEISMAVSQELYRFMHVLPQPVKTVARLNMDGDTAVYRVENKWGEFTYYFSPKAPYTLYKWVEKRKDQTGNTPANLRTVAVLERSIMKPYWQMNRRSYDAMRDTLALPSWKLNK